MMPELLGFLLGLASGGVVGAIGAGVVGYFVIKRKLANIALSAQQVVLDQLKTHGKSAMQSALKRMSEGKSDA